MWLSLSACSGGTVAPPVDASTAEVSAPDDAVTARDAATVSDVSSRDATAAGDAAVTVPEHPTWATDVAPILYRNCVGCHRAGGIGPFPLITYADARDVADSIHHETAARRMPPTVIDGSGACQSFRDDMPWLTTAQVDTLARWAAQGAPEGDPSRAPQVPPAPAGLDRVDVRLDMGITYTPNAMLRDDYRCFLVDPGLTEDQFITGYEVHPGDARVVHHMILYSIPTEAAEQSAMQADARDATPGYPCFGGPGVNNSQPLVLWAPGGGVTEFPRNTGLRMKAGRRAIMQVHYNLAPGAFPDRTRINLRMERAVSAEGYLVPYRPRVVSLPPRQTEAVASDSISLSSLGLPLPQIWVHGVAPHMHTLGRTLRVDVADGADTRCLVNVPNWNFHWQRMGFYAEPLLVNRTEQLTLRCSYDTTSRTTTTTWGEGTQDEMCLNYFYATLIRPPR